MRPRVPLWNLLAGTVIALLLLVPAWLGSAHTPTAERDWLVALATNAMLGAAAWAIGGVSRSGALTGIVIGTALFALSGWPAWGLLATTFVVAAGTTRVGAGVKDAAGIAEARRGRRRAGNVVANTGVAALWAIVGAWSGAVEIASVGLAGALAVAASDTAASEMGKACQGRTWRLWPMERVPPGTNGALSVAGTASGVLVSVLLAGFTVASGLVGDTRQGFAIAGAASLALVTESVIAVVAEDTGWLDNDGVNFVSCLIGSLAAIAMSPF